MLSRLIPIDGAHGDGCARVGASNACFKKHFSSIIENGAAACQEAPAALLLRQRHGGGGGGASKVVLRLRVELFRRASLAQTAFLLCQDLCVGIRRRPVLNSTAE